MRQQTLAPEERRRSWQKVASGSFPRRDGAVLPWGCLAYYLTSSPPSRCVGQQGMEVAVRLSISILSMTPAVHSCNQSRGNLHFCRFDRSCNK